MLEHVHIRINDHQILNGVKEYSVEVAVPGKYVRTFIGTCLADFAPAITDSFRQIFSLIGIPETSPVPAPAPVPEQPAPPIFRDANGKPQPGSPFAAQAHAKFEAQVIRNGKVVED
jgi:hypothetical protein